MPPTCGYTCPQCEGRGYTDDGAVCDWCSEIKEDMESKKSTDEESDSKE